MPGPHYAHRLAIGWPRRLAGLQVLNPRRLALQFAESARHARHASPVTTTTQNSALIAVRARRHARRPSTRASSVTAATPPTPPSGPQRAALHRHYFFAAPLITDKEMPRPLKRRQSGMGLAGLVVHGGAHRHVGQDCTHRKGQVPLGPGGRTPAVGTPPQFQTSIPIRVPRWLPARRAEHGCLASPKLSRRPTRDDWFSRANKHSGSRQASRAVCVCVCFNLIPSG